MLMGLENEMKATQRVLAAIHDAKRDYKPDPNARTAWELAWHLASADVQMLDEIADRKFAMETRFKEEPKTSGRLAGWYEKNFARAIERVRAMSAEELLTPVNYYGVCPSDIWVHFLAAPPMSRYQPSAASSLTIHRLLGAVGTDGTELLDEARSGAAREERSRH